MARLTKLQRQRAILLYRDAVKLVAIAAEFGCSDAHISRLARDAGEPQREWRGPRSTKAKLAKPPHHYANWLRMYARYLGKPIASLERSA